MKGLILATTLLAVAVVAGCSADGVDTPTATASATATEFPPATQAPSPIVKPPQAPTSKPTLRPPQPIPEMHSSRQYYIGPPSIDRQILDADVIVLASFRSATAGTETMPSPEGEQSTYRPVLTLNFTATEFLKGTGSNGFSVEMRSTKEQYWTGGKLYLGYLTEAEALEEATRLTTERNTRYDDRPGVLFLRGPVTPISPPSSTASGTAARGDSSQAQSSSSNNFKFVTWGFESSFGYSVDTDSRAWLPAREVPSSGARSTDGGTTKNSQDTNPEFIKDGTASPPPVVTLSDLRSRIGEIAAMLREGEGTEGYEGCIYSKLTRPEFYRNNYPNSWRPLTVDRTIDSGVAAGTALRQSPEGSDDRYNVLSVSGKDADYFQTVIRDDDNDASNGYSYDYMPARPLPAGSYTANFHHQHYSYLVCNHNPIHNNYGTYNVTVTSPTGTLHEAFFDPVTVGTAVTADGSNGVLKPTSFTVGGTATGLTSLEWSSNQVVLTLGTHVSLSGHVLDFIDLNGNVALSLFADAATVDSTAGTYTWSMTSQPWENGDQLMLRIREDG